MSKDKIADYDGSTAGNNTDIGGISIAEGMLPSAVNNSMRELTKQLGAFANGTDGIDVLNLHDDDASASIKIQAPSAVTTTTTLTLPDGDGDAGAMLQTNGSGQLAWSTAYRNRNLIINGAMNISQRGTSFAIPHQSATYTLDRYKIWEDTGGSCTISQSSTAPSGFANSYKVDITGADTSLAASEHCVFYQSIEAQDLQHLEFGTSSAKTLSVSFWVRSNKTGTYILNIFKPDQTTQMMSKSYTINSADTWEKKVISIPACTSSGIDNDNGIGLQFIFYLATGTAFSSGTLQTTWGSDTIANRAVGQVNLFDSTDNEWYMTGLQIEVGDVSPFEHRSYGDELAACKRYYRDFIDADASPVGFMPAKYSGNSGHWLTVVLNPEMRAAPTVTVSTWQNQTPSLYKSNPKDITLTNPSGSFYSNVNTTFVADSEL